MPDLGASELLEWNHLMARIFITGSADGLGLMAGQQLLREGHDVVLHARDAYRAQHIRRVAPGAHEVLTGDLSSIAESTALAAQANSLGRFDAVIHNAAVGYQEPCSYTSEGLQHLLAVNVLSPYLLTALMLPPARLVYLSSGMHRGGDAGLTDLQWRARQWNAAQAYSDSKLFDVILAFAVARRWPKVLSNAVDPGWVPTRMGGPGAPDALPLGVETQAWLAVSDEPAARVSGRYFYHKRPESSHAAASDPVIQDGLLNACAELTGVILSTG
jgi:NAD(P)-dependent dehydrogenase (short-subunit alcohol dehydrogenase family)